MDRASDFGCRVSELQLPTPDSRAPEFFAIASRDELWLRGTLAESHLMHGQARQRGDGIDATDTRDESLVSACDDALDAARTVVDALREAQVRTRVRATREDGAEAVETTMTIAIGSVSVVTTPADAMADYELLRALVAIKRVAPLRALPIVWQNGSAAVLLHEAIGHASEHGRQSIGWPSWLSVDAPLVLRRETFRDVPLPRMTHLVATQNGAPFVLPEERIEVHLIAGGAYDPVTDIVTIDVVISSAGPFTIRRTRAEIAASLSGATGHPIRYPGVICSREGQKLYVASHAPLLVTGLLA
jgi:hypothetical protein